MSGVRTAMTDSDIRTLMRGENADERAIAAHKLCRRIDAGTDGEDRAAAEEVLRLMSLDAAELVRRALAVTLKASRHLPREVALRLAQDVENVAMPVLSFSPVFTDEDLAEIVRAGAPLKQLAVARRPMLSETVTAALAEHAGEAAVQAACANDNADFSEAALQTVIARFAHSDDVAVAIAYRKALPPAISETLVGLVSDQVRRRLVDHHALPPETALALAVGARERATVDLIEQAGRVGDMRAFVAHLRARDHLTPSLLLRALAHGDVALLEWALAELSGTPHHRTWLLVHDGGALGLKAIYDKANLPGHLYPAFRAGVDSFHALQQEGRALDLPHFQRCMLERFLTREDGHTPGPDSDWLLDKMDRLHDGPADLKRSTAA